MNPKTLITAAGLLSATAASATTLNLDIGPNGSFYDRGIIFDSSSLFDSQQVSFNIQFNTPVHLFKSTLGFLVGLDIQLNQSAGFMTGSGFLLDAQGNSLGSVSILGSAASGNVTWVSLFPNELQPLDFYGVHFDLNLPEGVVTGSALDLHALDYTERGGYRHAPFRIGPQVPDSGTTAILLTCGLTLLTGFNVFVSKTK